MAQKGEKKRMKNLTKTTTVLLLIVAVLSVLVVSGMVLRTRTIENYGTIKSVGDFAIYNDQTCSQELTVIQWGQLNKGGLYQRDAYVKNLVAGDTVYIKWNYTMSGTYLQLTMEFDGNVWEENTRKRALPPSTVLRIHFSLRVLDNAVSGDFVYRQYFVGEDTA